MKDAAYEQYLGIVICPKAYKYNIIKNKEPRLSSNKTFIKATEQENESANERDHHLYGCLLDATTGTYMNTTR